MPQSLYEVCLSKTLFASAWNALLPVNYFHSAFETAQILAPRQSLSLHNALLKICVTTLIYLLMNLVIFLSLATRLEMLWEWKILLCSFLFLQDLVPRKFQ